MKTFLMLVCISLSAATALGLDVSGIQAQQVPNFHEVVANGIYRGGQPSDVGLKQLATAGFKTVINLRRESPHVAAHETKLLEALGIKVIAVPLSGTQKPDDNDIEFIENALNQPDLYPIFLHCKFGEDRTGLVVGLFRVFTQNYSPAAAYKEMLEHGFKSWIWGLQEYYEEKTGYSGF